MVADYNTLFWTAVCSVSVMCMT